jgi:hypothetical protein
MIGILKSVVGTLLAALVLFLVRWGWTSLRKPYDREEFRRLPRWWGALRWLMISEPNQDLTIGQRLAPYVICPVEGHEFPRDLEHNAGRWNLGDRWFGRCRKCLGLFERSSEEKLDEAERSGVRAYRHRTPKPRAQLG